VATDSIPSLAAPTPADRTTAGTVGDERRLTLMGTELTVAVTAGTRPAALAASERAVRALEAAEARLSTWRDDSELARLHAAPAGRPVELSPALAAELAAARGCWRATGGAFDPTVGALVAAWGIRDGGRVPGRAALRRARAATGMDALELAGAVAVRRRSGLALDSGGVGKGAGLDRALAALAGDPGDPGDPDGRAPVGGWLDLGGQVAVTGAGGPWRLTVADPARRDRPAVALTVDRGSVATTGTSERGRHVLDPRRGRPVERDGSVTVWAGEALTADCLSTALFVMGADRALAWAAARPGVEALWLEHRGGRLVARATPGLAGRLAPAAGGVTVEIWRQES
jgi:thiamine biosynthesis lipoprotein